MSSLKPSARSIYIAIVPIQPRHLFSAIAVFATFTVSLWFWSFGSTIPRYEPRPEAWGEHFEQSDTKSSPPTILLWAPPSWYVERYMKPRGGNVIKLMKKKSGGCLFTTDRRFIHQAHAVVFHDEFISGEGDFPPRHTRSPRQKYVFWTRENPYRFLNVIPTKVGLLPYDADFNWTMTYRNDSDIHFPYGCLGRAFKSVKEPIAKTKVAVMVASDCNRFGAILRQKYSDLLLDAGLKMERYGRCFGARFEGDLEELIKPFKFFMAFENALHCRDYITEKFWSHSLAAGLVPVVWGPRKEDVERAAPKNSFIHVEDFSNAEELASYLNYLDKNDSAYSEYLLWRSHPPAGELKDCRYDAMPIPSGFSDICWKIRTEKSESIIPSISEWWYGTETKECLATEITSDTEERVKRLLN